MNIEVAFHGKFMNPGRLSQELNLLGLEQKLLIAKGVSSFPMIANVDSPLTISFFFFFKVNKNYDFHFRYG